MPTEVWLLRHGEAVPHGSRPDSERELTPHGEHQARLAGRALALLSLEFDHCYTSPKVRARETARLACEELGVNFEEASALAAGFGVDDCRELLHAHGDGAQVLFVGHEPDLSGIVGDLTGARIDLKKGAVVALALTGSRRGELFALLGPRELEAMARR